jgi:predicted porin
MKKSLFAVAAATAFTGAAQAQSSVTVYGIIDAGYIAQSVKANGIAGTSGAGSTTVVPSTITNGAGFGSSAESTSRLGFRGTEDLGGGLRAFFTVEMGMTPTNVNNVSGGTTGFNNRQSFVGLGKNGLGQVSIGTQYTPIHEAIAVTDPGQQNNMPGNVIYNIDAGVNSTNTGLPSSIGMQNSGTAALNNALLTQVGGYGVGSNNYTNRAGNSIRFMTDRFAGVQGKVFYTTAGSTTDAVFNQTGNTATATGGVNQFTGWGAGLDYTWQKLLVTGTYQSFKNQTTACIMTTTNGQCTTGWLSSGTSFGLGNSAASLNSVDNQMYLGATYDFGFMRAYAGYINRKASALYDQNVYWARTAQQIGVRSFVTPTIETWASGGNGSITNSYSISTTNANTQNVKANIQGYQLGANYWMSKRTNLYAIYGMNNTSNAAYPTTTSGTATNPVSNGVSAYALGLRHTF